jgi:hypothetical protein
MFAWRTIWVSKTLKRENHRNEEKRYQKLTFSVNIQDFFFYREFNLDKVKQAHLANVKKDI